MSHDINYTDESGKYFILDETMEEGGTYAIGNKNSCLNVTYNYSWFYYAFLDKEKGIRWLYGKKGKECITRLKELLNKFPNTTPYKEDYWVNCLGNCMQPIKIFYKWCEQYPEGIFNGD